MFYLIRLFQVMLESTILLDVMKKLDYNTPLRINISLPGDRPAELVVLIFAVKEWRQLFEQIDF